MKKEFTQEELNEGKISSQEFFEEVRTALKDVFVARLHTKEEERLVRFPFPNG